MNATIAKSAVKAFNRHLTAEMVLLALLSKKMPPSERQALSDAILAVKPTALQQVPQDRFGSDFGKPHFPVVTEETRLADLVAVDSWFTIHLLEMNMSFLILPVDEWANSPAYQSSCANAAAINVINDCAERGVKLSLDFIDTARNRHTFPERSASSREGAQ